MIVQPYVFFEGRCEEALTFYREALGAEILGMMRYKESPEGPPGHLPPGSEDKIMHASFRIGESTVMASDGMCQGGAAFQGFSLVAIVEDEEEAKKRFDALADGGKVHHPLGKTFFTSCFGMVIDRFGVLWMVYAEKK